jgi:hypothetical protein
LSSAILISCAKLSEEVLTLPHHLTRRKVLPLMQAVSSSTMLYSALSTREDIMPGSCLQSDHRGISRGTGSTPRPAPPRDHLHCSINCACTESAACLSSKRFRKVVCQSFPFDIRPVALMVVSGGARAVIARSPPCRVCCGIWYGPCSSTRDESSNPSAAARASELGLHRPQKGQQPTSSSSTPFNQGHRQRSLLRLPVASRENCRLCNRPSAAYAR